MIPWRLDSFQIFPNFRSLKLVDIMFISNNCTSFHLWWKVYLVKHHKVSKYYENGCSTVLCLSNINFTFSMQLWLVFTLFRLRSLCSLWCGWKCLSIALENIFCFCHYRFTKRWIKPDDISFTCCPCWVLSLLVLWNFSL